MTTQNGRPKNIGGKIRISEETRESLALLKILARSSANIKKGNYKPARKAFEDIRKRIGR
jgi:hypothetical protein